MASWILAGADDAGWTVRNEQAPGHIVLIVEPSYEETSERLRRWQAGERDAADDNA